MKETLSKQSKETRCYIMSAILVFQGFNKIDAMTEIRGEMTLDVLGLTKEDIKSFPVPDYSQIVSHLRPISDPEVRHWVITNTYSPVLKSRKVEAQNAFYNFCSDLGWDSKEIKETTELTEELDGLKPIKPSGGDRNNGGYTPSKSSNSGCASTIALIIISSLLFAIM